MSSSSDQRAQLEKAIESSARAVQEAWTTFVDSEPGYVREYLRDQSRVTAVEQEAAALAYPGGVGALREAVFLVIEGICVEVEKYLRAVPADVVLEGWDRLADPSRRDLQTMARPFGKFFMQHGFDSGSKAAHPGVIPDWHYYADSTWDTGKTRRGGGLPLVKDELESYDDAVDQLGEARQALADFDTAASKASVADQWDA